MAGSRPASPAQPTVITATPDAADPPGGEVTRFSPVLAGHRVRYLTAAGLVETLYRAVSMLDRLPHHATTVVTNGKSYRMHQARERRGGEHLNHWSTEQTGGDLHLAKAGDLSLP